VSRIRPLRDGVLKHKLQTLVVQPCKRETEFYEWPDSLERPSDEPMHRPHQLVAMGR
jgi:hypothetical protein